MKYVAVLVLISLVGCVSAAPKTQPRSLSQINPPVAPYENGGSQQCRWPNYRVLLSGEYYCVSRTEFNSLQAYYGRDSFPYELGKYGQ